MVEKYVRICAVLIGLVFLALPVYADVVGTWDVTGTMKHKISIKHVGHSSSTDPVTDTFTFDSSGSFTATAEAATGTWQYINAKDTKADVLIPENQLITYLTTKTNEMIAEAGYSATVDNIVLTKNKNTVKQNKNGTLSGKWALSFTCNIHYQGYILPGKVKTNMKATMTKETVSAAGPASADGILSTLVEELTDQIEDAIMGF
jgi:hypothetical protein